MPSWQAKRAALKPDRLKLPVIPWQVRCAVCGHVRSSHVQLVLFGHCKADGCDCLCFDARCGCGHLLSFHMFGTARENWSCAAHDCRCRGFGAKPTPEEETVQPRLF